MNRVIHTIVFAGLFFLSFSLFAQRVNTRGGNGNLTTDTTLDRLLANNKTEAPAHKILLVPFYPKMLMSEIDRDVNARTHLSYAAITSEFRKELDLAMFGAMRRSSITVSLLDGRHKSDSVLAYIYGSTGYNYDMIPGTTPDVGSTEHDPKNHNKRFINKGELEVPVDYTKRFMNVNINNPHLLSDLNKTYHTDTYVFINELDITDVPNTVTNDLSADTYRRQVTVHYSILDENGKSISKGIATTYFPYGENDPKVIGEKYFTVVAHRILKDYLQGLTMKKVQEEQKNKSK